jgi:hypothetical protein
MIARKLDPAFIASAFFMWLALGILIPAARLVPISWLNGVCVALACAIPLICLVVKLDRQAIPVMIATTAVLGAGIGFFSGLVAK